MALQQPAGTPSALTQVPARLGWGQRFLSKQCCLQGHTPGRSKALLVSYRGTPYLFGGLAHTAFEGRSPLNPDAFTYATGEAAFMRFRMQSQTWEAACPDAAIPQGRMRLQTGAAGGLLLGTVQIPGHALLLGIH